MDFSHEKSRASKRDYGFFGGKGKITARLYSYDMQALCTHMRLNLKNKKFCAIIYTIVFSSNTEISKKLFQKEAVQEQKFTR